MKTHTINTITTTGRLVLGSYRMEATATVREEAETLELKGLDTLALLEALTTYARSFRWEAAFLRERQDVRDQLAALQAAAAEALEASKPVATEEAAA